MGRFPFYFGDILDFSTQLLLAIFQQFLISKFHSSIWSRLPREPLSENIVKVWEPHLSPTAHILLLKLAMMLNNVALSAGVILVALLVGRLLT